jgi:hypothetical protein
LGTGFNGDYSMAFADLMSNCSPTGGRHNWIAYRHSVRWHQRENLQRLDDDIAILKAYLTTQDASKDVLEALEIDGIHLRDYARLYGDSFQQDEPRKWFSERYHAAQHGDGCCRWCDYARRVFDAHVTPSCYRNCATSSNISING